MKGEEGKKKRLLEKTEGLLNVAWGLIGTRIFTTEFSLFCFLKTLVNLQYTLEPFVSSLFSGN